MNDDDSELSVPVSARDHVEGDARAPVTLVEYGDYQCPYCAEAYGVVRGLIERYGNDLRYVFRNFPLAQIHPLALPAAEVAEGAALLDAFWPMHAWLYENQARWVGAGANGLLSGVEALGLGGARLQQALRDPNVVSRIQADLESGAQSGVQGTPTFFINGWLHEGGNDAAGLSETIDAALAAAR
ncbi:MAG TPA: thioredoxin domain-containing protein [Casimicrobiaceae bacterium]|nr:thioredoxin domain-containing protein [Casimicrobiaceae bacterium]